MNNFSDLDSRLANDSRPVVFLDTCAILDIIRIPIRKEHQIQELKDAYKLVTEEKAIFVATDIVVSEFQEHADPVTKEVEVYISDIDKKVNRFESALEIFSVNPNFRVNLSVHALQNLSRNLINRILGDIYFVPTKQDSHLQGSHRQRLATPPAKKGKDNLKDCIIYEQYIDCAKSLMPFRNKKFFLTSNFKDFGSPGDSNNPVVSELNGVGLKYLSNYSWLLSEI